MFNSFSYLFFFLTCIPFLWAEEIEFKAERYERNSATNTQRGVGKAMVKKGGRTVYADEIELDNENNRVIANGNVHIFENEMHMFADKGIYLLSGESADLENGTILTGKMVLSGKHIRKLRKDTFEMDEGIYTNCNIEPITDKTANQCYFDWKIYGRKFHIEMEGFIHVYDVIIYAKELPVGYLPYYMAPAKTKRHTGFLFPTLLATHSHLGAGVTVPFFWAIDSWHDLTLSPQYLSKAGYHIGTEYRYLYDSYVSGVSLFNFTKDRFSRDRAAPWLYDKSRPRQLGILGEWAISLSNKYDFPNDAYLRQTFRIVSDPFYPVDFGSDLGTSYSLGYLRSQISASYPTENWLSTLNFRFNQSLLITKKTGTDNGSVGELPSISFLKKNSLLLNIFSYEIDTRLSNYYRLGKTYDKVPTPIISTNPAVDKTPIPDTNQTFDNNDYIREGRRLQLEPRFIINVPVGRGFELQPTIKTGTLIYQFDLPKSSFEHREYVDFQAPFSLYLAKKYYSTISGFETVKHTFQPRLTYSKAIYRSAEPQHQFFYDNTKNPNPAPSSDPNTLARAGFSNPRFDALDQVLDFHFGRVDLENRVLKKVGDKWERFLLLKIGQQYNFKPVPYAQFSNSFQQPIGPIELLFELSIWNFSFQTQASYQVIKQDGVNNITVSSALSYSQTETGSLTLSASYAKYNNKAYKAASISLTGLKTLPTFFDIRGAINYTGEPAGRLNSYELGFHFASKPVSCWELNVLYSTDTNTKINYAKVIFGLSFGGPVAFAL